MSKDSHSLNFTTKTTGLELSYNAAMCAFSMSVTVVNEIALITMLNDDGISSELYSRDARKGEGDTFEDEKLCLTSKCIKKCGIHGNLEA